MRMSREKEKKRKEKGENNKNETSAKLGMHIEAKHDEIKENLFQFSFPPLLVFCCFAFVFVLTNFRRS
jgi:hypothetical protein